MVYPGLNLAFQLVEISAIHCIELGRRRQIDDGAVAREVDFEVNDDWDVCWRRRIAGLKPVGQSGRALGFREWLGSVGCHRTSRSVVKVQAQRVS